MKTLGILDKQIASLIYQEAERQKNQVNLIASENYTHPAVLEAVGSILSDKYAEGYPSKRYYAGCEFVDQIENLAINRCKELFEAEHANVQAHSGSQANMAVYFSILKPGDTIMGMNLAAGGHLTHGHKVNFSGSIYNVIQYSVNPKTELLDYNEIEAMAKKYKPKIIIAGASAYSRSIDYKKFKEIADSINAYFLADIAHVAGLIAAKLHESPIKYADFVTSTTHKTLRGPRGGFILSKKEFKESINKAIMPGIQGGPFMNIIAGKAVAFKLAQDIDFTNYQRQVLANAQAMVKSFKNLGYRIVSNGTDNHLFIVDLRSKNITGITAELALEKAGITVSRSTIPNDPAKPWITSGIRIGTPAITTRGFKEKEAEIIVNLIDQVLKNPENSQVLNKIKNEIYDLNLNFSQN